MKIFSIDLSIKTIALAFSFPENEANAVTECKQTEIWFGLVVMAPRKLSLGKQCAAFGCSERQYKLIDRW